MAQKAELICSTTLPANTSLSFASNRICITRDYLERLPVSIPDALCKAMTRVSQIGLKDMYLGRDPDQHVRWSHAKGTFTVGMIWLKLMYDDGRIPARFQQKPFLSRDHVEILCGYALLLHDLGHLVFSHLLEEALEDINWVPLDGGRSSMEYSVLKDRLGTQSEMITPSIQNALGPHTPAPLRDPIVSILALTHGWSGLSWIQSIVNGPIDADKIDYLCRDQLFLTQTDPQAGYPIQTRLNFIADKPSHSLPWLSEFLTDQYVNESGFLCLVGRSALAAADLWRERLFMYDRFYLAPQIRAADRIAVELIQQFLIRFVMGEANRKELHQNDILGVQLATRAPIRASTS
jgi:HD superfamily phosphohydrolase